MRRSNLHRRGGAFTFMVLAMSILILVSGTLLIRATQNTFLLTVQATRQSQLREAAFSGVRWGARAAARSAEDPRGTLELSGGVTVEVTGKRVASGGRRVLKITSSARHLKDRMKVTATLVPGEAGKPWVLDEFSVRVGA